MGIADGDKHAGLVMRINFGEAPASSGSDRNACEVGLEDNRAQSFHAGTHGKDIESGKEALCIREESGEMNATGQPELIAQAQEFVLNFAIADDDEHDVGA